MVSTLIFKVSMLSFTFLLLSMMASVAMCQNTVAPPPYCETSDCAVSGSQLVAQLDDCEEIYDGNKDCEIAAYEFCVSQLLDTQKKNNCVCDPNTCSGGVEVKMVNRVIFLVFSILFSVF